jgi:hypothetical protein
MSLLLDEDTLFSFGLLFSFSNFVCGLNEGIVGFLDVGIFLGTDFKKPQVVVFAILFYLLIGNITELALQIGFVR